MSMKLDTEIFSWNCSIYTSDTKKWKFGILQLNQNGIIFTEETKTNGTVKLKAIRILFSNIIKMGKAKSSYIYPSIVIDLNKCQVWISSLINRDCVFNYVEHFWRDCLLDTRAQKKGVEKENQQLLNIAYETKEVLVNASNVLHQQGKQISNASRTTEKINNDIAVAERITGDIESWFGAWRVKGEFKNPQLLMERTESPLCNQAIEYPVLYGEVAQESHKCGQVLVRNKFFELLDESSEVVHTFPLGQISEIKVHSPWDVTVIKRALGKPSINIHLTSARMPLLLKILQKSNSRDLELHCLPKESVTISEIEDLGDSVGSKNSLLLPDSSHISTNRSTMLTKEKNISRQDADEISKVLNSMKTLAIDIGVEQDAQIKQIENLTENVDRANARLKSTTARVDYASR